MHNARGSTHLCHFYYTLTLSVRSTTIHIHSLAAVHLHLNIVLVLRRHCAAVRLLKTVLIHYVWAVLTPPERGVLTPPERGVNTY